MKKQWYKLADIADFSNINNFFAAEGTPTFENNMQSIQLWSESQFEDVFDMNSEKSIYVAVTNDPWGSFKNKYTQWLNRNKNFIADELDALLRKYNPIYNYDRHEVYGGSDTVTKTPTNWVQTKTETPDNWKETVTQTPTGWKQTETQTPTNWKEIETQTPTNWEKEVETSYTNFHETETQTPTNWEKTETQTPTNWQKQNTEAYTNYNETETQTPTDWVKTNQTAGNSPTLNASASIEAVIPFNGSDFANVSKSSEQHSKMETETQAGTYETAKTITGSKTDTETQSGTYQTVTEQAGTFETDKTKTGSETTTETQSGTYQTETSHTGTYQTETSHTGTYQTETSHSGTYQTETSHTGTYTTETATTGSRSETVEQEGTLEDETVYGKTVDIEGNIGVLSSSDMIGQIIRLYDNDFVSRWINRFFDYYCCYV
ncbi:MAG: hypothetical protein J6S85_25700 [Methanobrevibacter sp.]|nr:hypothetical protein [Methanobrevibacter sp.]